MRIVPRQAGPLENGWGVWYEGRIFKWRDLETARAGMSCLGLDPDRLAPVTVWTPEGGPAWKA